MCLCLALYSVSLSVFSVFVSVLSVCVSVLSVCVCPFCLCVCPFCLCLSFLSVSVSLPLSAMSQPVCFVSKSFLYRHVSICLPSNTSGHQSGSASKAVGKTESIEAVNTHRRVSLSKQRAVPNVIKRRSCYKCSQSVNTTKDRR